MDIVKTALICGQYRLPVLPGEAQRVDGAAQGYYEYINKRTKETGKNLLCVEALLRRLPASLTVYEPFGGIGAFACLTQGVVRPGRHVVGEIDADCLRQLRHAFNGAPGVEVVERNARRTLGLEPADLYLCDFPFHTLMRYQEWANEWQQMVSHDPLGILFMDGAISYLHLHTDTYSRATGHRVTRDPQSYAAAMSHTLHKDTGYAITRGCYSSACSYFLAQKAQPVGMIPLQRVPNGSGDRGFCWL